MDDLISRQDAITLPVTPKEYREYQTYNFDDAYEQGWDDLQKCIESLPSAQQWIPCSKRLPDQNGKYLVVGRQKAINILKFDGGRWYGKWGVVAWMPLPSPYREEATE